MVRQQSTGGLSDTSGFKPKPIQQAVSAATHQTDGAAVPGPAMVSHPSRDAFHEEPPRTPSRHERPPDDDSTPLWLTIPWILAAIAPVVGWHTSRIERMYDPALPAKNTWVGSGKRYTAGEGALPTYASPAQLAAQAQEAKRVAVQNNNSKNSAGSNSVLGVRVKGAEYLSGNADAPAHTGARWDPLRKNFTDVMKDEQGKKSTLNLCAVCIYTGFCHRHETCSASGAAG